MNNLHSMRLLSGAFWRGTWGLGLTGGSQKFLPVVLGRAASLRMCRLCICMAWREEEEEEEQTTEPTTVEVPAEPLVALPVSDAHVVVEVADACPHIHLAWLHRWPSNHVQEVIYFGDYQAGDMETST